MENLENKTENKKISKAIKIIAVIFGVVAFLIIANYVYVKRQIAKGELVNYYGKWYTKEELKKEFPPQYYDVPAKNTPEEVYTEFRQALLNNDIETALGLIRAEEREGYREAFKNKERFDKWLKSLPENLSNIRADGNFAHYNWDKGDGYSHTIDFLKDENGYWKIDNI